MSHYRNEIINVQDFCFDLKFGSYLNDQICSLNPSSFADVIMALVPGVEQAGQGAAHEWIFHELKIPVWILYSGINLLQEKEHG